MHASQSPTRIADAPPDNWVERQLPSAVVPYAQLMRLDRPIGWWLLLLPCWWAMTLAQIAQGGGSPNPWFAFLFLIGAVVMRGAGCVLNDIADRDFDGKVERTKGRPIPSGRVSVSAASGFLIALLLAGLAVLLQFNWLTIIVGASSLVIVAIYPFLKRITYWPQVGLGLAFNWGALVGWSAVAGELTTAPLLLYGAGVLWTLAYDTIYAHQDKGDDILIGIKSTALKFGDTTRFWLGGFFTAALLLIASAFVAAGAGAFAYAGLAATGVHALWQLRSFDAADSDRCLKLFKSNRTFGLLLLSGLLLDTIFS